MKKLYIILALVVVSILMVFAGDTIKILRVYHNGTFTAIPLANIDSIDHSRFDANGQKLANYTSSVIETLDSTYIIPICEIDSINITKEELDKHFTRIALIEDYMSDQINKEISLFQTNLLTWIRGEKWINQATINDNKDLITINFANGLKYCIDFQNGSAGGSNKDENKTNALIRTRGEENEDSFFDISSQGSEEIIEDDNIFFYNCLPNDDHFNLKVYNSISSNAESSPLNLNLALKEKFSKSMYIFKNDGINIITNTHGASDRQDGSFKIEEDVFPDGEYVYWDKEEGRVVIKNIPKIRYKWISPNELKKYINNVLPIVYGDYCWGYWIKNSLNCTVIGYDTKSFYDDNNIRVKEYMYRLLHGETHDKIMERLTPYTFSEWTQWFITCNTMTNESKKKLRYFSIKTNEITEEKGITGEIKGYKNFKDEIKDNYSDHFMLYVHKGTEKFTPKDIGVEKVKSVVKVKKADGTFTVSSDVIKEYPNCGFIVGFEYSGKVYYGEMIKEGIHLCPDDNHPHIIDLGLPSGTKWVCRNIGAQKPEEYGGYYAWGEIKEKDDYSQWEYKWGSLSNLKKYCTMSNHGTVDNLTTLEYSDDIAYLTSDGLWVMPTYDQLCELVNNCTSRLMKFNGVWGRTFTGPNGNTIFLPMAGYRNYTYEPEYDWADYWSSTLCKQFPANAYSLSFNNNMVGIACVLGVDYNFRDLGFSIRPVARQK